jgi:hypothetical protein
MRLSYPETLVTAFLTILMSLLVIGFAVGLRRGDTTPHWSYYPGDDPVAFDSKTGRACRAGSGGIVCIDYERNRITRSRLGSSGGPFDSLASHP